MQKSLQKIYLFMIKTLTKLRKETMQSAKQINQKSASSYLLVKC